MNGDLLLNWIPHDVRAQLAAGQGSLQDAAFWTTTTLFPPPTCTFEQFQELLSNPACPPVSKLNVYFVKNEFDEKWLGAVASHVRGLTVLKCSGCEKLRASSVEAFRLVVPSLTKLVLDNCVRLLSADLVAILSGGANLTHLSLAGLRGADDDVLRVVGATATHLSELDLLNCHKITDAGIEAVANLPLRLLSVGGCINITNQALKALEKAKSLETFLFPGLDNLSDAQLLESLGRHCPIRTLDARFCYHIKKRTDMPALLAEMAETYRTAQAGGGAVPEAAPSANDSFSVSGAGGAGESEYVNL